MTEAIQKAAETLVDRARNGDQNAMALLVEIKKNRSAGNPKAQLAFGYALDHIKRNPPQHPRLAFGNDNVGYSFGALTRSKDGPEYGRSILQLVMDLGQSNYDSRVAADAIANSRPVDRHTLRLVLSGTPPNVRGFFSLGYRDPLEGPEKAKGKGLSENEVKALQLGYIVGLAKRLQEVQGEGVPVSHVSPKIGWELD